MLLTVQLVLLDFVHELDVLLQLPAHHGQEPLIFLLELHHRHAALKELSDKHASSGEEKERGGLKKTDGKKRSGGGGSGGEKAKS